MENFSIKLGETILNLFLDQNDNLTNGISKTKSKNSNYIKNPKNKNGFIITITLKPKTSNIDKCFEIFVMKISHYKIRRKKSFDIFKDVLNNDKEYLEKKFNFITKLIISSCMLSPYMNFNNNRNEVNISFLRKKFFLDFKIEYKNWYDMIKPINLINFGTEKQFFFSQLISNSEENLKIEYTLINNLPQIIDLLKKNEKFLNKARSSKNVRNRFLSEEKKEIIEKSFSQKNFRFRSAMNIKIEDFNKKLIPYNKPFLLMEDVIVSDSFLEKSEIEELFLDNKKFYELEIISKKSFKSSSIFTEPNLSIKSRNKEEDKGEVFVADFEDIASVDNLYYIINLTKKAFYFLNGKKEDLRSDGSTRNGNLKKNNKHFVVKFRE